jgi:hypothetical protein
MKKKIINIIVILIVVLAGAFFVYIFSKKGIEIEIYNESTVENVSGHKTVETTISTELAEKKEIIVETTQSVIESEKNKSTTVKETDKTEEKSETISTTKKIIKESENKSNNEKPLEDEKKEKEEPVETKYNEDNYDSDTNKVREIVIKETIPPNPESWLEDNIKKFKDEINERDLEDFRGILSKLDQNYLYSLASDGLTTDEMDYLKEHLRDRLTNTEYNRSKELFIEYSFILEEI